MPSPSTTWEKRSYNVLKIKQCEFVGSFFALDKIPRDRRPQIAFAGRSNVGKSTLLNHLVGQRKMAKVSNTPGKTRSLNFFLINDRFNFVDLPGYGYAKVSKTERASWARLIEGYLKTSKQLSGLVFLLDCRRDPSEDDFQMLDWLADNQLPSIVVVTKTDKLNRDKTRRKLEQVQAQLGLPTIGFSSLARVGKNELLAAIGDLVDSKA
ncbi:MAG: ribosome biogenesis GTP-binding protein YihA/YsxC [candidate division Zixibacteria bacterium]|nr:ribosome biogenesis GTP-binding protein YihA/YsxC [candidate division Zixibacteria bacterium]MDH3936437.1 ribosome biogenesis GTP-binding protein YihA/YsxC [candidate division Zixibacteria bacterium]MDH4034861.1 ribosome biogenesis GTP-binding protein YihA/YsxC [candidate division Zixibacteria bacterium]